MTKTAENDAYQEGVRVVWHSPTEYDALRHGPPYLPMSPYAPVVLAAEDRKNVRAFAKKASEPLAQNLTTYTAVLGVLQAAALVHQTHHWSCRGLSFYADHLLFERLYNESLPAIDQLAERAVGMGEPLAISAKTQAEATAKIVGALGDDPTSTADMFQRSLVVESFCLTGLANMLKGEQLSPGTTNLLEGIADTHETFIYLLKQRSQVIAASSYSYRR